MERKQLNRLGKILASKGVKAVWVAEKLNLTKASVSNYVTNKHQPSLETLYQIATLLDIPVTDLLNPAIKIYPKEEPLKHKKKDEK